MPETTAPVKLRFTLHADDWIDGVIAYFDHVRFRWLLKPPRFLVFLIIVVGVTLTLIPPPDPWWLGVGWIALALMVAFYPKRWRYRRRARRLVAANPAWHHPMTIEFTDEGMVSQNPSSQSRSGWDAWGCFAETDRIFLLLVSDRPRTVFQVIPKRGLVEAADAERLAELLDRHLVRLPRRRFFPGRERTATVSALPNRPGPSGPPTAAGAVLPSVGESRSTLPQAHRTVTEEPGPSDRTPETETPITLSVTLSVDDWIDGAIVYYDHVRFPWLLKPPRLIVGIVIILGLLLLLIPPRVWPVGVAYIVLGLFTALRPKRRRYRRFGRRLVAANPAWHHPMTIEFTDEGMVSQNPSSQSRSGWDAWGCFAETDRIFLLLVSDRPRTVFQVIPKRGLAHPEDTRRLAELLDRHLVRLPRRGFFPRRAKGTTLAAS